MPAHIGIIACSAEGAAFCYRTICLESGRHMGEHFHPQVSMHTHSLGRYMDAIEARNWQAVADLMLSSAGNLALAGADFLICPDNTIHQAYPLVRDHSPLPWLHIAEVVVRDAQEQGFSKLGVLGTRFLMEGPVYRDVLEASGIAYLTPSLPVRKEINRLIFSELVNGIFTGKTRLYFHDQILKLKNRGCDAVVLGCTEIPLLVDPAETDLPVLDSTRLLARAAIIHALGKNKCNR